MTGEVVDMCEMQTEFECRSLQLTRAIRKTSFQDFSNPS